MSDLVISAIIAAVGGIISAFIQSRRTKGEAAAAKGSTVSEKPSWKPWLLAITVTVALFGAVWLFLAAIHSSDNSVRRIPSSSPSATSDRAVALLSTGKDGADGWQMVFVDGESVDLEEEDGGGLEISSEIHFNDPPQVHLTFRQFDAQSGPRKRLRNSMWIKEGESFDLDLKDGDAPLSIKILSIERAGD